MIMFIVNVNEVIYKEINKLLIFTYSYNLYREIIIFNKIKKIDNSQF